MPSISPPPPSPDLPLPSREAAAGEEDLVKEWNVDDFHEFDHSLLNIFGDINKPTFTIINCDVHKRRYPMLYKHRKRDDLTYLLNCIESFGGRYYSLASTEHLTSIPILFSSFEQQLNLDIVKAWKRNEENNNRIPRDVFSEEYILEIMKTGVLQNLNEFRTWETDFHVYDANLFLTGTFQWTNLRKLG